MSLHIAIRALALLICASVVSCRLNPPTNRVQRKRVASPNDWREISTRSSASSLFGTREKIQGAVAAEHGAITRPLTSTYGRRASLTRALFSILAASTMQAPVWALPKECTNGFMEGRQARGENPFAPPCQELDHGPPVFPILVVDDDLKSLLSNEAGFRIAVRNGWPLTEFRTPPTIGKSVFDEVEPKISNQKNKLAFRDAAQVYLKEAAVAIAMTELAINAKTSGNEATVDMFLDSAFVAYRLCSDATGRMKSLLKLMTYEMPKRRSLLKQS